MRLYPTVPGGVYAPYLHIHDRYELYCFLSGNAEFQIENNLYPLEPGDLLLFRPSEAHFLQLHSQENYQRIVIHFSREDLLGTTEEVAQILRFLDQRPMGRENRLPGVIRQDPLLLTLLNRIAHSTDWTRRLYLTTLLHELSVAQPGPRHSPAPGKGSISDVIRYIDENLMQPLSLELLSETFFFSRSQLNRSFRKVTGTTVWDYILEKRLLLARELLHLGHSPTCVCTQCRFGSYSSFFRAYKKRHGVSPKNEHP